MIVARRYIELDVDPGGSLSVVTLDWEVIFKQDLAADREIGFVLLNESSVNDLRLSLVNLDDELYSRTNYWL